MGTGEMDSMSKDDKSANRFIETQRSRYNAEAEEHFRHNQDSWAQSYRDKFVRKYLKEVDLSGKRVLDAMCASGIETGFLLRRNAKVTGLEISENCAELYKEKWGRECIIGSIHKTPFPDNHFDMVYVFGGLHHVLPILSETIAEIHRILKPNGRFVFVEPNKDTWLNVIRRIWYKNSSRFEDEEDAISYQRELIPYLNVGFDEHSIHYGGNIAYLLIAQSSIFGIGQKVKSALAKSLFVVENIMTGIPLVPKLFFIGSWIKK